MSHEHKVAIERIISLCEKTTHPNNTTKRILDIAFHAFGMTETQRKAKIAEMCQDAFQRRRDSTARNLERKNVGRLS